LRSVFEDFYFVADKSDGRVCEVQHRVYRGVTFEQDDFVRAHFDELRGNVCGFQRAVLVVASEQEAVNPDVSAREVSEREVGIGDFGDFEFPLEEHRIVGFPVGLHNRLPVELRDVV